MSTLRLENEQGLARPRGKLEWKGSKPRGNMYKGPKTTDGMAAWRQKLGQEKTGRKQEKWPNSVEGIIGQGPCQTGVFLQPDCTTACIQKVSDAQPAGLFHYCFDCEQPTWLSVISL